MAGLSGTRLGSMDLCEELDTNKSIYLDFIIHFSLLIILCVSHN